MIRAKRLFDVAASVLGLLALSPVMLVAAAAVKLEDGGPVFFAQTRTGRGFEPFKMYKFRSMRAGSEGRGPRLTASGDGRVTRVGRWLRKTKVDELPQLFNVLRGDMSIVGPRPELPEYATMFADEYAELLEVRPGITDYASIAFRNEEKILGGRSFPEDYYVKVILPAKLRLGREYLKSMGVITDVKIILATLSAL